MKKSKTLLLVNCFGLLLVILTGLPASGQIYEIRKAEITVSGVAREKPWVMTSQMALGSTELIFRNNTLIDVKSLSLTVEVKDLKSKNVKMDQRAYKGLKAYPYDRISFLGKIFYLKSKGNNEYMLEVEGNLSIAGITRITTVPVMLKINEDGSISSSAYKKISLSEFGIILQYGESKTMRLTDQVDLTFMLELRKKGASL